MAQEADDLDTGQAASLITADGQYRPSANSPTAMRRCGSTEEFVKSKGFTVAVTLTVPVKANQMQFCGKRKDGSRFVGRTDRLGASYGHGEIVLPAGYVVWVNPSRPGEAVAAGCLNHFFAHIPMPSKQIFTPTVEPLKCKNRNLTIDQAREAGLIITEDGRCVTPEAPAAPAAEECEKCPEDARLRSKVSKGERLKGGLKNTGVSAAVGGVFAGIAYGSFKDAIFRGAIPSAAANRVAQYANPSPNQVVATCGGKTRTFSKGEEGKVGPCELRWEDRNKVAVLEFEGQECKSLELNKNFNFTPVTLPKGSKKTSAPKRQTPASTPEHPAGQYQTQPLPGVGSLPAGTNGRSTRPTAAGKVLSFGGIQRAVPR